MADEDFDLSKLSPTEQEIVKAEVVRVFGSEKIGNIHEFLTKVIQEGDTTKLGYLTKEEVGYPHLTLRSYKKLAHMSKEFELPEFTDYFDNLAHNVVASPSLSKEGFLLLLSITEKKKSELKIPGQKKENKGWFGSKNTPETAGDNL
ncbi:MAG: hypothetical protein ABSG05_03465 [Candidatus Pacearchaeota archaeon]|jgi:hypothetical protein